jgi:hypothetical protein
MPASPPTKLPLTLAGSPGYCSRQKTDTLTKLPIAEVLPFGGDPRADPCTGSPDDNPAATERLDA